MMKKKSVALDYRQKADPVVRVSKTVPTGSEVQSSSMLGIQSIGGIISRPATIFVILIKDGRHSRFFLLIPLARESEIVFEFFLRAFSVFCQLAERR